MRAGAAVGCGVVAAMSERKIDAESNRLFDDIRLAHQNERRVNFNFSSAFDACFGSQVCHGFEGGDELGTAIGVAGIIDGVDADENGGRAKGFRIGQGEGKKNGIARRDVSHGDTGGHLRFVAIFGDGDVAGKRGAAERAKIEMDGAVFLRAKLAGDFGGGCDFDIMAMASAVEESRPPLSRQTARFS